MPPDDIKTQRARGISGLGKPSSPGGKMESNLDVQQALRLRPNILLLQRKDRQSQDKGNGRGARRRMWAAMLGRVENSAFSANSSCENVAEAVSVSPKFKGCVALDIIPQPRQSWM